MLTVGHSRCSWAIGGGAKAASSFFDSGATFGASRENWRGARPLREREGLAEGAGGSIFGFGCGAALTTGRHGGFSKVNPRRRQ